MNKNPLRKSWILLLGLLPVFFGCSKPALYGSVQEAQETVKLYATTPQEAFRATQEALKFLGYSIKDIDENNFALETYWQPTKADSHYVDVFGRKDFGTVGAYYRLAVRVRSQGNETRVSISNVAKSFISNLKSSQREEERIFDKVSDFTRKRDVQVTNIGLQ